MEAVFISLMAAVVLASGWVAAIVVWNLFKDEQKSANR